MNLLVCILCITFVVTGQKWHKLATYVTPMHLNSDVLCYQGWFFFLFSFFLKHSFALIAQAGVQWHDLSPPQSPPPRFKQFFCLSLLSSLDYKHAAPHLANFVFLVEMGFLHIDQARPELPTSGDPPASASQSSGIIGVSPRAWP